MGPVSIERLTTDGWQALRDVRLAAVEDSPQAFWAKLSDESRYGRPSDQSRSSANIRASRARMISSAFAASSAVANGPSRSVSGL